MTFAICLKCGEAKHGAWISCSACSFTPDDDESMTKSLILTDHYQNVEALTSMAAAIKSGRAVSFDPGLLKEMWVDSKAINRSTRNCAVGCVVAAVIGLAGSGWIIWRWL